MQLLKISCNSCRHYNECSQETRLYVNYCGTSQKVIEKKVKKAIKECKLRHGYLFQRIFISDPNIFSPDKETAINFSS